MWPNPQFSADLVTYTEEILNEKLHFLCRGNRLDTNQINKFKKRLRPLPNKVPNPYNPQGLKQLTKLRIGPSHLRHHKLKHNSLDVNNPLLSCGSDIEMASKFSFYGSNILEERTTLLSKISKINSDILTCAGF